MKLSLVAIAFVAVVIAGCGDDSSSESFGESGKRRAETATAAVQQVAPKKADVDCTVLAEADVQCTSTSETPDETGEVTLESFYFAYLRERILGIALASKTKTQFRLATPDGPIANRIR